MPSSTPDQRVKALSSQLSHSPNPAATATSTMSTTTETKPPITCHVLDTTAGKPASNIPVILTLHPSKSSSTSNTESNAVQFAGQTNSDGRVTSWEAASNTPFTEARALREVYDSTAGDQRWSLTFDTEAYFSAKGVETFFPEVSVKFVVRQRQRDANEHFHVPVLVGGFGYTTYRGS